MLRFTDFSDFCDLSEEEIRTIANGAKVTCVEACAIAHEAEDSPENSRKVLKLMQQYLEHVDKKKDEKRSYEVHQAIDHFASTHHFI